MTGQKIKVFASFVCLIPHPVIEPGYAWLKKEQGLYTQSYKFNFLGAPKASFWDDAMDKVEKGINRGVEEAGRGLEYARDKAENAVNQFSRNNPTFGQRVQDDFNEVVHDAEDALNKFGRDIEKETDHFWGGSCNMDNQCLYFSVFGKPVHVSSCVRVQGK